MDNWNNDHYRKTVFLELNDISGPIFKMMCFIKKSEKVFFDFTLKTKEKYVNMATFRFAFRVSLP